MRVLIVYASRHGQTQKISEHIAHIARIHGAEAHALEVGSLPRDLRVNAFDAVVLAGPVYFDKFPRKLARFASAQRMQLAKVKSAFVSVSGAAGNPALRSAAQHTAEMFLLETDWMPERVVLFAGGQPFTRYGFFTKWMMYFKMRRMGREVDPSRDYDYTDWDAVDRFAHEILGRAVTAPEPELALL
jgi:menaquinone-dependent protoporphyrinogen oxidase